MRVAGVVVVLWVGCGTEPGPPKLPGTLPPPCELISSTYLVTQVTVPFRAADYQQLSMDVDGDGDTENALGTLALQYDYYGLTEDVEAVLQPSLATARVAWLVEIATCSDESNTHARVALGRASTVTGDVLGGTGSVAVDGMFRTAAVGEGGPSILASLGLGIVPVSAFFDVSDTPISWSEVSGVTAQLSVSPDVVTGMLGFGVPVGDRALLYGPAGRSFNMMVQTTAGCPDACEDPLAMNVLDYYDADASGSISESEVAGHPEMLVGLAGDDLDLEAINNAGSVVFWPLHDGDEDHMSFVVGVVAHRVSRQ